MVVDPGLRAFATDLMEAGEEAPVGVELAGDAQFLHHVVGRNGMDQHPLDLVGIELAVIDQLGDESDRAHLPHQRRIEADLVDPVHDVARGRRHVRPLDRIDVHDQHVARLAAVDQREDGGIAHVAAVPVVLALDLDRLVDERQTGRGQHPVDADVVLGEDLHLAGAHIGGRDEQLDRGARPHALEIDHLLKHSRAADCS